MIARVRALGSDLTEIAEPRQSGVGRRWAVVREVGAIVAVAAIVAGCAERALPVEPAGDRPYLELTTSPTVPDAPCLLSKPNAAPPPGTNRFVFGAPLLGIDCAVQWYMDNFPVPNILLPGFEFLPPYLAPDSRSSRFQYGTGNIQIGPIYMIFYSPIDVFASTSETYDWNVPGPSPPGPPDQHILAYDVTGRLLVDTIGGAVTVIRRPGIQNLTIYPAVPHPVVQSFPPDTVRYRRIYSISFRVDSSCPPSGDSVLDSRQVRDAFRKAMARSLSTTPELEAGGEIYRMLDGTYQAFPVTNGVATACSITIPYQQPPAGADYLAGFYHTHPQQPGQPVCGGTAQPNWNGGGSDDDWGFATTTGKPVYAYSKEGRVSRLNANTAKGSWNSNTNRWKTRGKGCFA